VAKMRTADVLGQIDMVSARRIFSPHKMSVRKQSGSELAASGSSNADSAGVGDLTDQQSTRPSTLRSLQAPTQ